MKRLLPLLLAATLLACGDDDPTDPSEPYERTFTGTLDAGAFTSHTFTAPRGGTLEAVLTWPSTDVDLDLYLTAASCTGYPPDDCTIIDSSDAFSGRQETVTHSVSSGDQLELWVDSFAEDDSGYTLEVTID